MAILTRRLATTELVAATLETFDDVMGLFQKYPSDVEKIDYPVSFNPTGVVQQSLQTVGAAVTTTFVKDSTVTIQNQEFSGKLHTVPYIHGRVTPYNIFQNYLLETNRRLRYDWSKQQLVRAFPNTLGVATADNKDYHVQTTGTADANYKDPLAKTTASVKPATLKDISNAILKLEAQGYDRHAGRGFAVIVPAVTRQLLGDLTLSAFQIIGDQRMLTRGLFGQILGVPIFASGYTPIGSFASNLHTIKKTYTTRNTQEAAAAATGNRFYGLVVALDEFAMCDYAPVYRTQMDDVSNRGESGYIEAISGSRLLRVDHDTAKPAAGVWKGSVVIIFDV